MTKNYINFFIILLLLALALIYFLLPIGVPSDNVFLSIATFLFSVFTGFFIARQGRRYSSIRRQVSNFDGNMSFIYRASLHLGNLQRGVASILNNHYTKIIETSHWDYHFNHKSTTITDLHNLLEREVGDEKLAGLKNNAMNRIMGALLNLQIVRKNMVALYQERIPKFQWFLIYIFVTILLSTISIIPSTKLLLPSVLKAAFSVSIVSVVIILHKFDNLSFFEGTIGEHSAQDVLDILNGKK